MQNITGQMKELFGESVKEAKFEADGHYSKCEYEHGAMTMKAGTVHVTFAGGKKASIFISDFGMIQKEEN